MIAVFLTLILGVLSWTAVIFVQATKSVTREAIIDGAMHLACQSVVGEFDLRLKEEYGIFAFYGNALRVEDRLLYYSRVNLPAESFGLIRSPSVYVSTEGWNLDSVEVFEKAIVDYGNFIFVDNKMDFLRKDKGALEVLSSGELKNPESDFILSKEAKLDLPSKGAGDGYNFISLAANGGFDLSLKSATDGFYVNKYIQKHFNSMQTPSLSRNSVFNYELEYILFGGDSDKANIASTESSFLALRRVLNLSHIALSWEKRQAIILLAQSLSPGPVSLLTIAIISGVWAEGEARNDWKRIIAGEKVDFVKTDATWALSLENAYYSNYDQGYVSPLSDAGISYEDYIFIFLGVMDKKVKLARTMDLIQLNLSTYYYPEFEVKNYLTGFTCQVEIDGKTYAYDRGY